jgi:hypothetical protein
VDILALASTPDSKLVLEAHEITIACRYELRKLGQVINAIDIGMCGVLTEFRRPIVQSIANMIEIRRRGNQIGYE